MKKKAAVIALAVVAAALFGAILWLNRPADMIYDLTVSNQEGDTMPVRLDVTINRYLTKRTAIEGTVYFNGKQFRLFTNPPWERRSLGEFIGKLKGEVATTAALDKSRPGTLDNVLWIRFELDGRTGLRQLFLAGGGQNDAWYLDWDYLEEYILQPE